MISEKKAHFIRKPIDLAEVIEETKAFKEKHPGYGGLPYYVAEEKHLTAAEWAWFTDNLLAYWNCLARFSERSYDCSGAIPCIRITGEGSSLALIVDTQGYEYARYVAIENA